MEYPTEQSLKGIDYNINIQNRYTHNKRNVPRVTEILSYMISEPYLLIWANNLGKRGLDYQTELNKAADIGTQAHSEIERFLKTGTIGISEGFRGFQMWWNQIKHIAKVISMEERITCEWFGGTYDLLIEINGQIYLVDFKTSNRISYKHFMQVSAYRYMLYHSKGINVNGVIILMLNKKRASFKEFVLNFSIPEHYNFIEWCTEGFLSLTYSFYNTLRIKEEYESSGISKGGDIGALQNVV